MDVNRPVRKIPIEVCPVSGCFSHISIERDILSCKRAILEVLCPADEVANKLCFSHLVWIGYFFVCKTIYRKRIWINMGPIRGTQRKSDYLDYLNRAPQKKRLSFFHN
jgi:hypothetical protein